MDRTPATSRPVYTLVGQDTRHLAASLHTGWTGHSPPRGQSTHWLDRTHATSVYTLVGQDTRHLSLHTGQTGHPPPRGQSSHWSDRTPATSRPVYTLVRQDTRHLAASLHTGQTGHPPPRGQSTHWLDTTSERRRKQSSPKHRTGTRSMHPSSKTPYQQRRKRTNRRCGPHLENCHKP